MNINDLRDGMRKVDVEGTIVEKGEQREVSSRYTNETFRVADAVIKDESGTITLTLWGEQIDNVNVDDKVKIENGYIKSFRGEIQLNVGKYGTLTVL